MSYTKGDIIWVSIERRNRTMLKHPAIVWDNSFDGIGYFHGIMITHTEPNGKFDNILMNEEHFENGNEVEFNNSHFVNQLFIKFSGWGSFHKGVKLTNQGIDFVEANLSNRDTTSFDEYLTR